MAPGTLCCCVGCGRFLVMADLVLLWLRVEPFVTDTRSFSFGGIGVVEAMDRITHTFSDVEVYLSEYSRSHTGGIQCRRTMNLQTSSVRSDEGYHSRSTAQIKERLV